MKLVIDEKICIKHGMTLSEVLMALSIRSEDPKGVTDRMLTREIIVKHGGKYLVTQHWSEVLDDVLSESGCVQDETRIKTLAEKMRENYPQGRMIDKRTGKPTPYYFRCNPTEIQSKLKRFFERYGNFSDEDILDAEKRYVESWNGNFQQAGFRQLKYFIWKDDPRQGPNGDYVESISPLLDLLTNKESDEGVPVSSYDWMMNARN